MIPTKVFSFSNFYFPDIKQPQQQEQIIQGDKNKKNETKSNKEPSCQDSPIISFCCDFFCWQNPVKIFNQNKSSKGKERDNENENCGFATISHKIRFPFRRIYPFFQLFSL